MYIYLIYGVPESSIDEWKKNIEIGLNYDVPHISTYVLTVEPKTALKKLIESKDKVSGTKKQHTCHYFVTNLDKIKYYNLVGKNIYYRPKFRLTLDYPEDLKLYRILFRKLKDKTNLKNVIRLLDKSPSLARINANKKNPYYYLKFY